MFSDLCGVKFFVTAVIRLAEVFGIIKGHCAAGIVATADKTPEHSQRQQDGE
jgi:hypothetical protein